VLTPSYDNQDNLWILDKADSAEPRLRVRNRDGDISTVKTSFHGDSPVVLKMAPDGVRALMVMKSKSTGQNYVQTGAVQSASTGKQLVLGQFRQLRLQLNDITDAAWNKQGILVVGTSTTGNNPTRLPWLVNSDGSRLQLLPGSPPGFVARTVASNPNKDTLPVIEDVEGRVHWLSRDLLWTPMDADEKAPALVPVYPG
jgi:hypothetical protein